MVVSYLTDGQLMAACQQGDATAWQTLVQRYVRLVYAIPRKAGFGEPEAAVIARAVFADLHSRFTEPEPTPAHVLPPEEAIVRATLAACDRRFSEGTTANVPSGTKATERWLLPPEVLQALRQQHRVRAGILQLAERCQALIGLLFYTHPEPTLAAVAERMQTPEADVPALRARCLRYLRATLGRGDLRAQVALPEGQRPPAMPAQPSPDGPAAGKPCQVPFDQLIDYAHGELRGQPEAELERHLRSGCARCNDALAWLIATLRTMRTDDSRDPPPALVQGLETMFARSSQRGATRWQSFAPDQRVDRVRAWRAGALVVATAVLVLALAYAAWQFVPQRQTAIIERVLRGSVQLRPAATSPLVVAQEGQIAHAGADIVSAPGSAALVRFHNDAYTRIESEGEWVLLRLEGSRNGLVARITVRQREGQASYASAPPLVWRSTPLVVALPLATLRIVGVCTVASQADGRAQVQVLQGSVRAQQERRSIEAQAGQSLTIAPSGAITVSAADAER